jgi:hypothetical protein
MGLERTGGDKKGKIKKTTDKPTKIRKIIPPIITPVFILSFRLLIL